MLFPSLNLYLVVRPTHPLHKATMPATSTGFPSSFKLTLSWTSLHFPAALLLNSIKSWCKQWTLNSSYSGKAMSPCNTTDLQTVEEQAWFFYPHNHKSLADSHGGSIASKYCQLILFISSFFPEILVKLLTALTKVEWLFPTSCHSLISQPGISTLHPLLGMAATAQW